MHPELTHSLAFPARTFSIAVLAAGITLTTPDTTKAALLSYEGFDYPSGATVVGQNGGIGFANAWQLNSSAGIQTNLPASLSYTDPSGSTLITSGGSLFLQGSPVNNANAAQPNRNLSYARGTNAGAADGVTTWVSFLAFRRGPATNSTTVPNNPYPRSANLSLYNNTAEKLATGNTSDTPSNTVALLPVGNIANIRTTSVNYSQTNFMVLRIDHKLGANDEAYLFLNPPLAQEPALSSADTNSIGEFDYTFTRIRPFAGSQRDATQQPYAELVLDEIRIGETFADVAPYQPKLGFARNDTRLILTWPGAFNLESATNVSGPYEPVPAAASPHTNDLSAPEQFFRLAR